ncbi:MAG: DUF488 domain-containing protein [Planctomycetaceae bacterium]|nr:DUF488 domain-containing protein [Planctomycetaceae bacterium]
MAAKNNAEIFTVGHSTRSAQEFVQLLRSHGVRRLVDVRSIPRSRHNPQFNREELGPFLRRRRINYRHMPSLGGLRHPRADSANTAWRNAGFRGFADYMQTPQFQAALDKLIALAGEKPLAIMCAEAVPWRCHRGLIADALTIRGIEVRHIVSGASAKTHVLNPMAVVKGKSLTYPGASPPIGQTTARGKPRR